MTTFRPLVLVSGVFAQLPQDSEIVTSGNATSTGGSVTVVQTGTGLTGGPIVVSGAVNLEDTAVTPGIYSYPSITVDQQGRITNASSNPASTSSGTVEVVDTGTGLTGGPITESGVISLSNTAVTAGDYKASNISVDAQGRLTAAANGAINDLSDVTITTIATNQLLQYDGSAWVNVNASSVGGVTSVNGNTGAVLSENCIDLTSLSGVTVSSPTDGQVLMWDNSALQWQNSSVAAVTAPGSGDISINIEPNTGLTATGDNANANQTTDTTRTIAGVAASATVSGVLLVQDSVTTTDSSIAASLTAVKEAYDHVVDYAPDFTGSGATGDWGINVTGSSHSVDDSPACQINTPIRGSGYLLGHFNVGNAIALQGAEEVIICSGVLTALTYNINALAPLP